MKSKSKILIFTGIIFFIVNIINSGNKTEGDSNESLAEVFKDSFLVGTCVSKWAFKQKDNILEHIASQFNCVTHENELKWTGVNIKEGVEYNFKDADKLLDFAKKNDMKVFGHVFVWHEQVPDWIFKDATGKPASRELLLKRMKEHINTLAKHTKGKIAAWDVVNEAFEGNGTLRKSKWQQIIGDDYIEQAFRFAQEAVEPDVQLIYNDYGMNVKKKREAVVKLIKDLKSKGLRIDAVGMQAHYGLSRPLIKDIEESIIAFSEAGVKVHITELDVDILPVPAGIWGGDLSKRKYDPKSDPYKEGLPEEMQNQLAKRYADLFALFLKHQDKIDRVTFWGPSDKYSWKNNFPIPGRTNYPTLFDRDQKPKEAFHEVIKLKKIFNSDSKEDVL